MTDSIPHRRWAVFLLGICTLVTAVFALNIFTARRDVPAWFWLLFQVGTALLLTVIVCYLVVLLRQHSPESPEGRSALWIWLCLVASVICTSSLHGFFPFRPSVVAVWESLPPNLKFIKYNYVFTAGCLLVTVALALLFFCRRRRLALVGLLLLSGVMLTPNDDCPNVLNLPWIASIGASPLMFLCNSVVAMSSPSYPPQIQQRLESGRSVITVVVRGEKNPMFPGRLAQEKRTAQTIESLNPHSRFVVKSGETHGDVAKYWTENLTYILQVERESNSNSASLQRRPHVP